MQQTYSKGRDNYENKKEPVRIMQMNDLGHPAFSRKPYLALERPGKHIAETKNDPGMVLNDIFGALDY